MVAICVAKERDGLVRDAYENLGLIPRLMRSERRRGVVENSEGTAEASSCSGLSRALAGTTGIRGSASTPTIGTVVDGMGSGVASVVKSGGSSGAVSSGSSSSSSPVPMMSAARLRISITPGGVGRTWKW